MNENVKTSQERYIILGFNTMENLKGQGLTLLDKTIYCYIAGFSAADSKYQGYYGSIQNIADILEVDYVTVWKTLKKLVAKGLLLKIDSKNKKKPNFYRSLPTKRSAAMSKNEPEVDIAMSKNEPEVDIAKCKNEPEVDIAKCKNEPEVDIAKCKNNILQNAIEHIAKRNTIIKDNKIDNKEQLYKQTLEIFGKANGIEQLKKFYANLPSEVSIQYHSCTNLLRAAQTYKKEHETL